MFDSVAYAMSAPPGAEQSSFDIFMSFFPLLLLVAIFYFFLFRPQQKKQKETREMIANIKEGDNVMTLGGMYGSVVKVKDDVITLQVAENVRVKVNRYYLAGLKEILDKQGGGAEIPARPEA